MSAHVGLPVMLVIMSHCPLSTAHPHLLKGHGGTDHDICFLLLDLPCNPHVLQMPYDMIGVWAGLFTAFSLVLL